MRRKALIALTSLVLSPVVSLAQDASRYAPKVPAGTAKPATLPSAKPQAAGRSEQLLPKLKGLVFVPDPKAIRNRAPDVAGISAPGLPLLESDTFRQRVGGYLNKPLSMAELNEITAAVVLRYRDAGRPVVDAIVPEQDITSGIVQILVQEARVGKVKVEENKYFSAERIAGNVRFKSGDPIDSDHVLADLDWINRNPFRRVDLAFERGSGAGETDLVLLTHDRVPFRVYGGYENTGTQATGEDRLLAGFNWGDAFGLDHQLNYQFTTSPDYQDFNTHWASYLIPLPWRHELTLIGSYTVARPDAGADFDSDGYNWQTSARYEIPLPRYKSLEQSVTLGFDFKRSNNNLEFGGDSVYGSDTDIAQYSIAYDARVPDKFGQTSGTIALVMSPGGFTSQNSDEAFQVARDGADSNYVYANLQLRRDTSLPWDFTLTTRLQGQVSDGPLLGSEQLGFGGMYSVRGYNEFQAGGDKGWILSNEVLTPPMRLGELVGFSKLRDNLQFLAFVDYGVAYDDSPSATKERSTFASVGPGVRYSIGEYVSVRYDYGFQLTEGNQNERHTGRHHLSVIVSYSF